MRWRRRRFPDVKDPMGRVFRAFAEQTKSDLKALAACIRGSRQTLSREQSPVIGMPDMVAVGTKTWWRDRGRRWPL